MGSPGAESPPSYDVRSHYLVERELANRLRESGPQERRGLYGTVYDELFRRVPAHPQLTEKRDPAQRGIDADRQVGVVERYLHADATFLEIGAGDLAVSLRAAARVARVIAVEVSTEVTAAVELPPNVELVITDGVTIEVPEASVDVAYSHQLMEHLHPDDARAQLESIYAALAPGGVYVCLTPNRLSGPHDVSKYFDDVATGFHLKEYTVGDLATLFRDAGFATVRALVGGRGSYVSVPTPPIRVYEAALSAAPRRLRRTLAHRVPFRVPLGVGVVARKARAQLPAKR